MEESFSDNTELRTEEVQDILSRVPHWIIRWGSICIFLVLLIFILISCFLKYPTIIIGNVKLTTEDQPVNVVNKMPGRIEAIYFNENTEVEVGSKLALIENPITGEGIDFLRRVISNAHFFLAERSHKIDSLDARLSFGYLQNDYNNLVKGVKDYEFFKNNKFYSTKIYSLEEQIRHYKNLETIAKNQLVLGEQELNNAREKFDTDKKLYANTVISKMDFLKAENDFIRQKKELEGLKKYLEETGITGLEYSKQLNDIKFEYGRKEMEYVESIKQSIKIIESAIANWRQDYVVEAPISGRIFFRKNIIEKQHLNANEELFVIVPHNQSYMCIMDVSSLGFGRLREGQKVRIKLDNYPFHEYGQLIGRIKNVPLVPFSDKVSSDNGHLSKKEAQYRVLVELDSSKKTTYNKILSLNPEMTGIGEVETDKLTLLQRFFYQVRGDFDN